MVVLFRTERRDVGWSRGYFWVKIIVHVSDTWPRSACVCSRRLSLFLSRWGEGIGPLGVEKKSFSTLQLWPASRLERVPGPAAVPGAEAKHLLPGFLAVLTPWRRALRVGRSLEDYGREVTPEWRVLSPFPGTPLTTLWKSGVRPDSCWRADLLLSGRAFLIGPCPTGGGKLGGHRK